MRWGLLACVLCLSASAGAADPPTAAPEPHPSVHVPVGVHVGPALVLGYGDVGAGWLLGGDIGVLGSAAPGFDAGARLFAYGAQVPICKGDGGEYLGTAEMCGRFTIEPHWSDHLDWTMWVGLHLATRLEATDRVRLRPSAGLEFLPLLYGPVPLPGLALDLDVAVLRSDDVQVHVGLATHALVWLIALLSLAPSLTLEL
jgi:hypothetical protein